MESIHISKIKNFYKSKQEQYNFITFDSLIELPPEDSITGQFMCDIWSGKQAQ